MKEKLLRYHSEGAVHLDFHGLMCRTLHYLAEKYGLEAIRDVMTATAKNVYKTMHQKLKNGDVSELVEFWTYYYQRENGKIEIEKTPRCLKLTVHKCPAMEWLEKNGFELDRILCEATRMFNEALADGSCFSSRLEISGSNSCIQVFESVLGESNDTK
jgi:hypothetical protein